MLRIESELLELLVATAKGDLGSQRPVFSDEVELTVVVATKGYPVDVPKGSEIRGAEGLTHGGRVVGSAPPKERRRQPP